LAWSPEGKVTAVGKNLGQAEFWSTEGRKNLAAVNTGGRGPVTCVAFSGDGTTALVGGEDGAAVLFDLAEGKVRAHLVGPAPGNPGAVFSPDGRTLATSGPGRTVKLWQVATGQELLTLEAGGIVQALAFSPGGKDLVAAVKSPDDQGQLVTWRAAPDDAGGPAGEPDR
jgi:WD40 repeat protein